MITKIDLGKSEKGNEQYLRLEVYHYNGKYSLNCRKETVVDRGGYSMTEYMLFADGNFNYSLFEERKSSKKLSLLNEFVERNKETLLALWKDGKYRDMGAMVYGYCKDNGLC